MAKENSEDRDSKPVVLIKKKKQDKMPERHRTVTLVHSEYKEFTSTLTTTLKRVCAWNLETQSQKDLRHLLIPIYKYLASHIADLFGTEEIERDLLSGFKLCGIDPIDGEVKVSYILHYEGKKFLHRITFRHERYPFTKLGKPADWEVV